MCVKIREAGFRYFSPFARCHFWVNMFGPQPEGNYLDPVLRRLPWTLLASRVPGLHTVWKGRFGGQPKSSAGPLAPPLDRTAAVAT